MLRPLRGKAKYQLSGIGGRSRGVYLLAPMRPGARTPEELETLFEDAFVIRDREALAELFEDGALLVAGGGSREARGGDEIARLASDIWGRNGTYLADPRQILQARNTALIVAKRSINVVHRRSDGAWRYAIALLSRDDTTTEEDK
jgi:hypothetical protein